VADVMNTRVISIGPGESIWSAAILMDRQDVKRLPVVDEQGYLLGVISRADLIKTMARSDDTIRKDVVEAVGVLGEETIADFEVEVKDAVVHLEGTADRRSTHEAAVKLAGRVPGVVGIVDRMDHEREDTGHTRVRVDRSANWNADIPVIEGRR
jgi:CBS domain-containing protein